MHARGDERLEKVVNLTTLSPHVRGDDRFSDFPIWEVAVCRLMYEGTTLYTLDFR